MLAKLVYYYTSAYTLTKPSTDRTTGQRQKRGVMSKNYWFCQKEE